MAVDDRNPVRVDDLRKELGVLASEPMIALQLQELEAIECAKNDFLPKLEKIVERLDDEAGEWKERKQAADMGLEIVSDYLRYNQRWNDTLKTLMAILKMKAKASAGEEEDPNALSAEQARLIPGAKNAKVKKR